MQNIKNIIEKNMDKATCSVHLLTPNANQTQPQKTLSHCSDTNKADKRIDLLFSRFAAFYGHVWRSQFKDEAFLRFAKKEWFDALKDFADKVIIQAILTCRETWDMPPTLPQVVQVCRDIKNRETFYVVKQTAQPANKALVMSCLQRCREILAQ